MIRDGRDHGVAPFDAKISMYINRLLCPSGASNDSIIRHADTVRIKSSKFIFLYLARVGEKGSLCLNSFNFKVVRITIVSYL